MNSEKLAKILRQRAAKYISYVDPATGCGDAEKSDDAELFCVLARVLEGKPVQKAFGAPGDWGYGTPIGDALAEKES